MAAPLHFESEIVLGVPPSRLWPLVSDTDRLNRTLDLPPVAYAMRPDPRGGSLLEGSMRVMGMTLRWKEHPFEWIEGQRYEVEREFTEGPLERVRGGVELVAVPGGTRVKAFADVTARGLLGGIVARRIVGPRSTGGIIRALKAMERHLLGQEGDPFPRGESIVIRTDAYNRAAARLAASCPDAETAGRLLAHVRIAHEEDVVQMRPFVAADAWGVDRMETLRVFLHATRAGLLDLSWEVLCANCRVSKASLPSLGDLKPQAHCETCGIAFDADFARSVELRFSVHPSIREAHRKTYCIGGPANTPHVVAQLRLARGEERKVFLELGPGRYRVRSPQASGSALLAVSPGAPSGPARFRLGIEGVMPECHAAPPGVVSVAVESGFPDGGTCLLEREAWSEQAATAALVTHLPEFSELFPSEILSPGARVGVRSITFLFTDLASSTALYRRVGDAPAFGLVSRHFELLGEVIERHRGGIVKTIGDAVMASFPTASEAVAAAIEMQRRFLPFAGEHGIAGVDLKIGVHGGPCIALATNGRNDYFGGVVNVAARAQGESAGGDIVLTDEVFGAAGVEAAIRAAGAKVETFEAGLKGLPGRFALRRVRVR